MKNYAVLLLVAVSLAGCVTAETADYVQIAPGPTQDYAMALCRIHSQGTQTGFVAFGSSSYVAGAAIGNAIGNAIAADRFIRDCMTLQGWKQLPPEQV